MRVHRLPQDWRQFCVASCSVSKRASIQQPYVAEASQTARIAEPRSAPSPLLVYSQFWASLAVAEFEDQPPSVIKDQLREDLEYPILSM